MKKLLAVILASILLLGLVACGKEDGDDEILDGGKNNEYINNVYNDVLTYDVNDDGDLEITGIITNGITELNVTVPAEINGRDVTGIADSAFKSCVTLKSVTFEGNLLYIGEAAFYGCTGLTEITLPATVTDIKANAFRGCTNLKSIALSADLETIEIAAFWDCTALESVVLPEKLTVIEGGAFWNCSALSEVAIPASVTSVGDAAFYGCSALVKASYSEATTIGESVFDNCAENIVVTVK